MTPEVWWHVARAAGIVAWLLLTASVLWGVVLATDLFGRWRRAAWLLDLHRWLGGLTVSFVAVHVLALIADSWVHFDLLAVTVPLASEWQPWPVALGVVAMWSLVVVQVTSLARRRLSPACWHRLHIVGYVAFVLASLHGTFAGTDAPHPLYVVTSSAAVGAVLFATLYRLLTRRTPSAVGESAASPLTR